MQHFPVEKAGDVYLMVTKSFRIKGIVGYFLTAIHNSGIGMVAHSIR